MGSVSFCSQNTACPVTQLAGTAETGCRPNFVDIETTEKLNWETVDTICLHIFSLLGTWRPDLN
jgi:hypothetical protein